MAYKAVSTNESHIAHSSWKHSYGLHGGSTYQYVPTHNGIGNPHHGVGGMFTQNPAGNQSTSGNNASTGGSTANNTNSSSGSSNSSSTSSGPVNPTRKDPYTMTNEQLKEDYTRAQLIANYNKYYPSKSDEYVKSANNTKQLISDGGAFVKKMMPDKVYVPLDLSGMSDEELRAANNRAQLESQYNQYFNPPKQNKSKEWVDVAVTGANLLISASAIAAPIIYDVIKAKKGQGK